MEFTKSLIKGKLIKRYKRFFIDVKLNKEVVTAHCPNTGSMRGLLEENNDVYLLKNTSGLIRSLFLSSLIRLFSKACWTILLAI